MNDEKITTAIEGLRSRIDVLASIDTDDMLIPGGPQERYHQLVEEACAQLSLIETQLDKLRDAKLAGQGRWEDQLYRVAYHEAGHTVAAIVLKYPFCSVTIVPKDDMVGYCSTYSWPRNFHPDIDIDLRTEQRLQSAIIACLAGNIAEKHFRGNNWVGSETDHKMAVDLAFYLVGSEEELNAYLKLLKIRTEGLVRRYQREIAALASALLTEKTIQGKRAREIFWATQRSKLGIKTATLDVKPLNM